MQRMRCQTTQGTSYHSYDETASAEHAMLTCMANTSRAPPLQPRRQGFLTDSCGTCQPQMPSHLQDLYKPFRTTSQWGFNKLRRLTLLWAVLTYIPPAISSCIMFCAMVHWLMDPEISISRSPLGVKPSCSFTSAPVSCTRTTNACSGSQ